MGWDIYCLIAQGDQQGCVVCVRLHIHMTHAQDRKQIEKFVDAGELCCAGEHVVQKVMVRPPSNCASNAPNNCESLQYPNLIDRHMSAHQDSRQMTALPDSAVVLLSLWSYMEFSFVKPGGKITPSGILTLEHWSVFVLVPDDDKEFVHTVHFPKGENSPAERAIDWRSETI